MVRNRDAAEEISKLMLDFGNRLDASVALVDEKCSPTGATRYKKFVANLMAEMLLEVMNPLYEMHPDLKPKELD